MMLQHLYSRWQYTLLKPDWILLWVALFHAERIIAHQSPAICVYMHTNGRIIVR